MKVLIAFLLGVFFLSGTAAGRSVRRAWVLAAITVVVTASYYSLRVVQ